MEFIIKPWPWFIAGPLIGLTVPILLILGNKSFGISSSLRHFCAACIPSKLPFFDYEWKKEVWNLFFVTGIFIGGIIAANFLGVATFEGYGHPPSTHFKRVNPFLRLQNDPMTNVFLLNAYSHDPRFKDALTSVGINRIFVDDNHGSLHSFKFP